MLLLQTTLWLDRSCVLAVRVLAIHIEALRFAALELHIFDKDVAAWCLLRTQEFWLFATIRALDVPEGQTLHINEVCRVLWGRLVVCIHSQALIYTLHFDILPGDVVHVPGLVRVGFHAASILLILHSDVAEDNVLDTTLADGADAAAMPILKVRILNDDVSRARIANAPWLHSNRVIAVVYPDLWVRMWVRSGKLQMWVRMQMWNMQVQRRPGARARG